MIEGITFAMKRGGTSIILLNSRREVLLFLRDDDPGIPYPNVWDLPGGHIEAGETPMECIVREMMEEIETDVSGCSLLKVYDFPDRTEYVFLMEMDVPAEQIPLHEGQRLQWFGSHEWRELPIAYGFDLVLDEFFASC